MLQISFRMADSVSKRQALLEESIYKKAQSSCPNTRLDMSIISPKNRDTAYHNDSGYTGLDSTPRPFRKRIQRNVQKPRLNNYTTATLSNHSMAEIIHYIVVILVAASLCFGILVGDMVREKNNMK